MTAMVASHMRLPAAVSTPKRSSGTSAAPAGKGGEIAHHRQQAATEHAPTVMAVVPGLGPVEVAVTQQEVAAEPVDEGAPPGAR